jgi:hypothetical protein
MRPLIVSDIFFNAHFSHDILVKLKKITFLNSSFNHCCGFRLRCFLDPGIRYGKVQIWDPESILNILDPISASLSLVFCVKNHSIPDPGSGAFFTPVTVIRKTFFSYPGSRIPDPKRMIWRV